MCPSTGRLIGSKKIPGPIRPDGEAIPVHGRVESERCERADRQRGKDVGRQRQRDDSLPDQLRLDGRYGAVRARPVFRSRLVARRLRVEIGIEGAGSVERAAVAGTGRDFLDDRLPQAEQEDEAAVHAIPVPGQVPATDVPRQISLVALDMGDRADVGSRLRH